MSFAWLSRSIEYTPRARASGDRSLVMWLLVLLVVCAASYWLRAQQIEGSLPYPRHVDEGALMNPAARILTTGDYNPRWFHYPSLPIYFTSASMAVGFLRSAADLEVRKVDQIGSVSYPYYSVPIAAETAKQFFAFLSIVTLAAAGAVAFYLLGRPSAVALVPTILTLSPYFFHMSWGYVNVDIVGACFVTLTLAAVLKGTRQPSTRWLVVIPGICAGLAASSKYTCALVLLPLLIGIWLFGERGRRLDGACIAVLTTVASFVVGSPYTVLDLPNFLNGLAYDVYHYASGHVGYESEPGLAKLGFYGGRLLQDFGMVAMIVAGVGLVVGAVWDWRRTLVLMSFPVVLLALLASQRVEFARNMLPVLPCVAILVGSGIFVIYGALMEGVVNRWLPQSFRRQIGTMIVPAVFVLCTTGQLGKFSEQATVLPESRILTVAWIKDNIPSDRTILVPEELELDARPLKARGYEIRMAKFSALDSAEEIDALIHEVPGPVVVLVPTWGIDHRFPGAELAVALNEAARDVRLKPLKSYRGRNLQVNYPRPIRHGNPAISISVPES